MDNLKKNYEKENYDDDRMTRRDREEQLEKERTARIRRLWIYRIVALLGLIAIILILIFKPIPCDCNCEEKITNYISSQSQTTQTPAPTAPSSETTNN